MNIDEIEVKIRAAVAEAKAKGWRIIRNAYYAPGQCCPLGACIIESLPEASRKAETPEHAGKALGITPMNAIDIAVGVDWKGAERVSARIASDDGVRDCSQEFVDLGIRLRDLVDP